MTLRELIILTSDLIKKGVDVDSEISFEYNRAKMFVDYDEWDNAERVHETFENEDDIRYRIVTKDECNDLTFESFDAEIINGYANIILNDILV